MGRSKLHYEANLNRNEIAGTLSALWAGLRGEGVCLAHNGDTVRLSPHEAVDLKICVTSKADRQKIEVRLRWPAKHKSEIGEPGTASEKNNVACPEFCIERLTPETLRQELRRAMAAGHYAGAIEAGDVLVACFAGHAWAAEFLRIRDALCEKRNHEREQYE